MNPVRQLAQLLDRELRLLARLSDQACCARWIAREPRLGEPEHHRQGDQALLRAVVQITLDALALGVGGRDDALPRVAQVVDPLAQDARTSRFSGLAREADRLHLSSA